ncbi:hypothetical protein ACH5RR_002891 [Cinchona calisaya]|uniref:Uncharacterized protein n=1 Tax=Cinchona calisaya TaxID=153742 RepID=A0ABD3AT87_9GENT
MANPVDDFQIIVLNVSCAREVYRLSFGISVYRSASLLAVASSKLNDNFVGFWRNLCIYCIFVTLDIDVTNASDASPIRVMMFPNNASFVKFYGGQDIAVTCSQLVF